MNFMLGFLGAFIGIILLIVIVVIVIMSKIRNTFGSHNLKELIYAIRNAKDLQKQEYAREKSVNGMTKLLEPLIREDFSDFN